MTGPTLKKTHALLEKLTEYVINEVPRRDEVSTRSELEKLAAYVMTEVPRRDEVPTRSELEKLAAYVMTEVPTKREVESRFRRIEHELEQKADKKDLEIVKENVQTILNGMDSMVKNLDVIRTEQKAFISGLRRLEKRVETLEKKMG